MSKILSRGAFIVIEGLDRCGKTTQVNLLAKVLKPSVIMNFPDRTTLIGKSIDNYLKNTSHINDQTIHLLFSANRWEHEDFIRKTLLSGKHIVCGRYAYSGVCYSHAKGLDLEWCKSPDRGLPEPDLVIFLDIDINEASKRAEYGDERYEKKEFQKKVYQAFQKLMKTEKKFKVIDASKKVEEIHEEIMKYVNETVNACKNLDIPKLWL